MPRLLIEGPNRVKAYFQGRTRPRLPHASDSRTFLCDEGLLNQFNFADGRVEYTMEVWGHSPTEIPAERLRTLTVRRVVSIVSCLEKFQVDLPWPRTAEGWYQQFRSERVVA